MILRLAERARRFETEEEKVLPFYASSLTEEETANVVAAIDDPPTHKLAEVSAISCMLQAPRVLQSVESIVHAVIPLCAVEVFGGR